MATSLNSTERNQMKKLWVVLAILLTFTLTTEVAHAKRFGGGKSFGRTYQTTPSQPSRSGADIPAQRQQAAAQAPAMPGKKSMLGGLLGGLLVGGLFAALFAGGAFHGLQMMDILIAAALAFVAFKIFRLMRQGNAPATSPRPGARLCQLQRTELCTACLWQSSRQLCQQRTGQRRQRCRAHEPATRLRHPSLP